MLYALQTKYFDTHAGANGLSNNVLRSSSLMALIATFVSPETDIAVETKSKVLYIRQKTWWILYGLIPTEVDHRCAHRNQGMKNGPVGPLQNAA